MSLVLDWARKLELVKPTGWLLHTGMSPESQFKPNFVSRAPRCDQALTRRNYSLTQSAFVLISGRLGAIYGHLRLLLLGGAIFIVFSLCNAFCTTYASFIAARALTGIGGGILMPNAVAALTIMIPPGKTRNYTLALFAASPPIGALVGALIVGTIFKFTEWKWFFIIM